MGASYLIIWANGSFSFSQNETNDDWWIAYRFTIPVLGESCHLYPRWDCPPDKTFEFNHGGGHIVRPKQSREIRGDERYGRFLTIHCGLEGLKIRRVLASQTRQMASGVRFDRRIELSDLNNLWSHALLASKFLYLTNQMQEEERPIIIP